MHFIMQLIPVVLLVATLFTLFYLSFAFVPRIHKAWKQRRWDKWCKENHYVHLTGDDTYWKNFWEKLGE